MEFQRIKRLPPYVFSIIDGMKMEARRRGEDIVDFGMGNPDLPTPRTLSPSWSKRQANRKIIATPSREAFTSSVLRSAIGTSGAIR